ncbi:4-oxalomesaconate tautomerase [Pollutimonas thiosulfatoxidans]|uniref:4-oxalomesaconate tautomerase n=1 Tax=Pollutimonas thiosulfatoxidans TaxID=2028345 RepID=A0A410GD31_9BURK|nr:4-oxalomesaconate tautomerase [Pollutimonas thiosulfatoxidans]QAA94207.1 hypothetical protein CKA81_10460 [Pollutimonas thiosulfatoxidans]
MQQIADQYVVPCVVMRGGTSKGPFFLEHDLPKPGVQRDQLLLRLMGALEPRRVDGIGGIDSLTNKIAIISRSERADADVDYLFGQICVHKNTIDYSVNCGNMLAAVGPFAIDTGLVPATDSQTQVRIYNVNTEKIIHASIRTSQGRALYEGDAAIDGVAGNAAAVWLDFKAVQGSKTGKLLPTGKEREILNGIEVSCVDAAVPMILARASDFGLSGFESAEQINADQGLLDRVELLRQAGGRAMGLGEVAKSEMPKLTLVAPPQTAEGSIAGRYFMPYTCHTSFAVTGAVCLAAAAAVEGTVVHELVKQQPANPVVCIEHPSGKLKVEATVQTSSDGSQVVTSAKLLRTARRLMAGDVYVPLGFMQAETGLGETE